MLSQQHSTGTAESDDEEYFSYGHYSGHGSSPLTPSMCHMDESRFVKASKPVHVPFHCGTMDEHRVSTWHPGFPPLRSESGHASEIGPRSRQEDNCLLDNQGRMWGVFDGHRGNDASNFASNFLSEHVETSPLRVANDAAAAASDHRHPPSAAGTELVNSIRHLEASMKASRVGATCGTTVCVAMLRGNELMIANLGDSRALVVDARGAIRVETEDHKPHSLREQERLVKEGAPMACGRLDGELNVSRGIGDFDLKQLYRGISNVADLYEVRVNHGDALILATDGIWDVVRPEEAASLVAAALAENSTEDGGTPRNVADSAAKALVRFASHERRSCDNCTAVVVVFK